MIVDRLAGTLNELAEVHVVGTAVDEASASNWLEKCGHTIDLLITDIFLKSGSGLGVLRSAKGVGIGARRIVLTNYCTGEMREKCIELGADRVFDKSQEIDELLDYCIQLSRSIR